MTTREGSSSGRSRVSGGTTAGRVSHPSLLLIDEDDNAINNSVVKIPHVETASTASSFSPASSSGSSDVSSPPSPPTHPYNYGTPAGKQSEVSSLYSSFSSPLPTPPSMGRDLDYSKKKQQEEDEEEEEKKEQELQASSTANRNKPSSPKDRYLSAARRSSHGGNKNSGSSAIDRTGAINNNSNNNSLMKMASATAAAIALAPSPDHADDEKLNNNDVAVKKENPYKRNTIFLSYDQKENNTTKGHAEIERQRSIGSLSSSSACDNNDDVLIRDKDYPRRPSLSELAPPTTSAGFMSPEAMIDDDTDNNNIKNYNASKSKDNCMLVPTRYAPEKVEETLLKSSSTRFFEKKSFSFRTSKNNNKNGKKRNVEENHNIHNADDDDTAAYINQNDNNSNNVGIHTPETQTLFRMSSDRIDNVLAAAASGDSVLQLEEGNKGRGMSRKLFSYVNGSGGNNDNHRDGDSIGSKDNNNDEKNNKLPTSIGGGGEEETVAAQEQQKQLKWQKRRRKYWMYGLIGSILIGIIAGITCFFLLSGNSKNNDTTDPNNAASTNNEAGIEWTYTDDEDEPDRKDKDDDGDGASYIAYSSPTVQPTIYGTSGPTISNMPSDFPSIKPTNYPTTSLSESPSAKPSSTPSLKPSSSPSFKPSVSIQPTDSLSVSPTNNYVETVEEFLGKKFINFDPSQKHNKLAIEWLAEEAQAEHQQQQFASSSSSSSSNIESSSPLDPTLNQKLVQRFALLSLDYKMQNPKYNNGGPLIARRNVDECYWTGVVCNTTNTTINNRDGMYVTEIHWSYQNTARGQENEGGGSIADEISLFGEALQILDLSNNDLQGTIPESLYVGLTNLKKLILFKNQLEGTISKKVGNLDALEYYQLSHNNLEGTIPIQFKSDSGSENGIRPLKYFNLYENQLTGTIPENLRFRDLTYFDVGRNSLKGTLPNDLGEKFVSLRHLYLDHNKFTGTLPASYNTVGNGRLESFHIDSNKLTGIVPGKRTMYNKLVEYTLHNNDFDYMQWDTCKIEVPQGECVELRADCSICQCNGYFNLCQLMCE